MAEEVLQTTLDSDGILLVTLNRPEKLNAYTAEMGLRMAEVFEAANHDDAVRAIIVTGAGRGFCAGADISGGADTFGAGAADTFGAGDDPRSDSRWAYAIYNCLKPSIAAINGPAMGVGFTMTLPMDWRLCSSSAKFGPVFASLGLFPEAGAAWFLPRIVGTAQATQWCILGEAFGPDEALRTGLVSQVTEPDALLDAAFALARRIVARTSPVSVAVTRQLFQRCAMAESPDELLMLDSRMNREAGQGGDVAEGVTAMLERRAPKFPGVVSRDLPPSFPWKTG